MVLNLMQWRAFGALLLVASLIMVAVAVSNIKTYDQVEAFARNAEDGIAVTDVSVPVPPWNASDEPTPRGWVGYNITLENLGKYKYEASGIIMPNDNDRNPSLLMRAVNETGLRVLMFEGFDPYIFDSIKVYAAAILNSSRRVDNFGFVGLDSSPKYILLFRGLKNETQDRPFLLSVKEKWSVERNLMEPVTSNVLTITGSATAIIGLAIAVKNPGHRRKVHRV
jgi:hypothetical protein